MDKVERIASETGLLSSSTMLSRMLAGNIHGPNGAVKNSWMKPPRPFARRAKKIIRKNTLNDMPRVALTSAVGTGFQYSMPAACSGMAKKSAGIILMRFIIRIQQNSVMAIGVTSLLRPG